MVIVSNSSPLIAFAGIGQLDVLPAIFGAILIPPAVALEIAPSIPDLPTWLQVQSLKLAVPCQVLQRSLGPGEREALALAVEVQAARILLDDLPARRIARTLNVTVTGTVGVLLVAKRHGVIEHVRPSLDALMTEGFFVGAELYDEVLQLADEFDQ